MDTEVRHYVGGDAEHRDNDKDEEFHRRDLNSQTSNQSYLADHRGGMSKVDLTIPSISRNMGNWPISRDNKNTGFNVENDSGGGDKSDKNTNSKSIDSTFPSLEGFRQHVLLLNPALAHTHTYLVDRIAHQQVVRYNRLVQARAKHQELGGNCPSGPLCVALGGATNVSNQKVPATGIDDDDGYLNEVGSNLDSFPENVPSHPVEPLCFPAEFECQFCFQKTRVQKPSDWTKHIHYDVRPFTCTWERCRDSKSFRREEDWVRHENEGHRHLEWWRCDVEDCRHICYRLDNFLQHLVREHKFPEPQIKTKAAKKNSSVDDLTWRRIDQCHFETSARPLDEPCRFCGLAFSTWEKLVVHLAKHMEQISLPVLHLVAKYPGAHPIIINRDQRLQGASFFGTPYDQYHLPRLMRPLNLVVGVPAAGQRSPAVMPQMQLAGQQQHDTHRREVGQRSHTSSESHILRSAASDHTSGKPYLLHTTGSGDEPFPQVRMATLDVGNRRFTGRKSPSTSSHSAHHDVSAGANINGDPTVESDSHNINFDLEQQWDLEKQHITNLYPMIKVTDNSHNEAIPQISAGQDVSEVVSPEVNDTNPISATHETKKPSSHSGSIMHLQSDVLLSSLPEEIRIVLTSIPKNDIWLSREQDLSIANTFKVFLEDRTNVAWDWWPLEPCKRLLQANKSRLFWKCTCGSRRWEDISLAQNDIISNFIRQPDVGPRRLIWCRPRRLGGILGACLHIIHRILASLPTPSWPSSASERYTPLGNFALSSASSTSALACDGRPHDAATFSHRPVQDAETEGTSPTGIPPDQETQIQFWILFGAQGQRKTLNLIQIPIAHNTTDYSLIQELRRHYETQRGWLKLWFSIWQLQYCEIVKFHRLTLDRLVREYRDLPLNHDYYYKPRAGTTSAKNPPISAHAFRVLFEACPEPCRRSLPHDCIPAPHSVLYLERIPKRRTSFITDTSSPIWGIEVVLLPSALCVALYHVAIVIGPFIFWLWWLRTHPDDLQNASVPLTIILAGLSLFWASTGLLGKPGVE